MARVTTVTRVVGRSPVLLVLVGILSVQFGASVAKTVFDDASPTGIVWLRLAASAVVLCALARPALRGRSRADWTVVLAFGLTLGLMNWSFYQSFARIPLGIAVTIEFAGPLTLAVLGSRRPRDLLWVGLAVVGVVLLGTERSDLDPVGVGFALLAAAMLGLLHPAQRPDRTAVGGPRRARSRQRGRRTRRLAAAPPG